MKLRERYQDYRELDDQSKQKIYKKLKKDIRQELPYRVIYGFLTGVAWILLLAAITCVGYGIYLLCTIKPVDTLVTSSINNLNLTEISWDWIAVAIACLSLFFACKTFNSQRQTEKNTMKIHPESQREIFLDHVRHYYRNLVAISAVEAKLGGRFKEFYPSQEHLLKLKVNLDDLHPAAFYNHLENYKAIHKLGLLIRNFNSEIDTAVLHLCDQNVDESAKRRDFATLKFKMGYLTQNTVEILNTLWPDDTKRNREEVKNQILTEARNCEEKKADIKPEKSSYIFKNYSTVYTCKPEPTLESDDNKAEGKSKNGKEKMSLFKGEEAETFMFLINRDIIYEMRKKSDNGFDDSETIFLIPYPKKE